MIRPILTALCLAAAALATPATAQDYEIDPEILKNAIRENIAQQLKDQMAINPDDVLLRLNVNTVQYSTDGETFQNVFMAPESADDGGGFSILSIGGVHPGHTCYATGRPILAVIYGYRSVTYWCDATDYDWPGDPGGKWAQADFYYLSANGTAQYNHTTWYECDGGDDQANIPPDVQVVVCDE